MHSLCEGRSSKIVVRRSMTAFELRTPTFRPFGLRSPVSGLRPSFLRAIRGLSFPPHVSATAPLRSRLCCFHSPRITRHSFQLSAFSFYLPPADSGTGGGLRGSEGPGTFFHCLCGVRSSKVEVRRSQFGGRRSKTAFEHRTPTFRSILPEDSGTGGGPRSCPAAFGAGWRGWCGGPRRSWRPCPAGCRACRVARCTPATAC